MREVERRKRHEANLLEVGCLLSRFILDIRVYPLALLSEGFDPALHLVLASGVNVVLARGGDDLEAMLFVLVFLRPHRSNVVERDGTLFLSCASERK